MCLEPAHRAQHRSCLPLFPPPPCLPRKCPTGSYVGGERGGPCRIVEAVVWSERAYLPLLHPSTLLPSFVPFCHLPGTGESQEASRRMSSMGSGEHQSRISRCRQLKLQAQVKPHMRLRHHRRQSGVDAATPAQSALSFRSMTTNLSSRSSSATLPSWSCFSGSLKLTGPLSSSSSTKRSRRRQQQS